MSDDQQDWYRAGRTANQGGAWPSQPPTRSTPGGGEPERRDLGGGGGRRWRIWGRPGRRGRRIALILGTAVVVPIAGVAGTYFWLNGKLNRSVTLPTTSLTSAGTNWLITGSDSRAGLSRA